MPPNELSEALDVIRAHGEYSTLWKPTTILYNAVELRAIIETLQAVATKYHGDDGLQSKADRAQARSEHAKYLTKEKARRAALNAPLLAPITPEKEQAYTRLIKTCKVRAI